MKQVLVIDDEAAIRLILGEALRAAGFDPILKASGAAALEALQSGASPVAIVVDLVMPGLSGPDVIERVRANPLWRDIPIIVTTGDEPPPPTHPETQPYDALLVKPFRLRDLVQLVEGLTR